MDLIPSVATHDLADRINELERTIEQQRRAAVRARTQHAVLRLLAGEEAEDDGIVKALEAICATLDWGIGLFWTVDAETSVLRCSHAHVRDAELQSFAEASRTFTFRQGVGIPGTVWMSRRAISMADVTASANYPRMPLAVTAGLRGAIASPVLVDDSVAGVVEFYNRDPILTDEDLLAVMARLGVQIGLFLRRRQTQADTAPDAPGAGNERPASAPRVRDDDDLLLALDASRCGVWRWHAAGNTVEWSSGFESTHGIEAGPRQGRIADVLNAVHPEDRPHVHAAIQLALDSGEAFHSQYRVATHTEETRRIEANGVVALGTDGRAERMVVVCRDAPLRR